MAFQGDIISLFNMFIDIGKKFLSQRGKGGADLRPGRRAKVITLGETRLLSLYFAEQSILSS
jgi:hypothetical protein